MQQAEDKLELTDEQECIASSTANNLVVDATAGSGKSSSILEYANRRPRENMYYLAVTRSVKEEAARKFPRNVKCVTTHGLAFPVFGARYKSKLGNPKAFHIANALPGMDMISAGCVMDVVNTFIMSTDREMGEEHAANVASQFKIKTTGHLMDYARQAWEMMQDVDNRAVPMPPDGYLKLYQMSNPVIGAGTILLDEAQDANPVTLDFISKQKAKKIFVGDKYQSIFGFRGAVDALNSIEADERLLLSASFRFGNGIAQLASEVLAEWRGSTTRIRGLGRHESVFTVDRNCPHAVIARTNGGLFEEAVGLVASGKPFGFLGGVEGYRFDQILDTYNLMRRGRGAVRDQFLSSFESFDALKQYGESLNDKEAKLLVKVVEKYKDDIPSLVEEIKQRAAVELVGREVVLATAHRAKGMEWKNVVLTDDFTELASRKGNDGQAVPPSPEEIHILYVALTRAMRGLQVPLSVRNWVFRTGRGHLLNDYLGTASRTPASSGSAVSQGDDAIDLPQWFKDMDGYFGEVHESVAASREDAEAIAEFLERQARRFR